MESLNNRMCIKNENIGYDMVSKSEKEINTELKLFYMIKACEHFMLAIKYSNKTEKLRLRSICDKYIEIGENLKIQLENEKKFFKTEK